MIDTPNHLLWAEATLAWTACPYLLFKDDLGTGELWLEKRLGSRWLAIAAKWGATAAILVATLRPGSWIGWAVLLGAAAATGSASGLRDRMRKNTMAAELEMITIVAVTGLFWWASARADLAVRVWFEIPGATAGSIASACQIAAILVFLAHGGNHFVRGILDKAKIDVPPGESTVGRYIGALERVIMAMVVAAGSYEALAFLVAAKGFLRSGKLKDEKLSEYFLVGNLASVALAILAGIAMRAALTT